MPKWAWRSIAAVLVACALFPIWSVRYLPLLDWPNHLASVAIWHHIADRAWGMADSYRLQITPFPYLLFHGPVHLLSYLMPVPIAGKVYLSLYAIALPASVAALAASLDRPWQWGLFAFPFVYSWELAMGWVAFAMGLAAALATLALLVRVLDEESTPGRLALLGLGACSVYLLHVIAWAFLGAAAIVVAVVRLRSTPAERTLRGLLLLLPSVELAYGETILARAAGVPLEAASAGWLAQYEPKARILNELGRRLIDVSVRRFDEVALGLVAASTLVLIVTGLPRSAVRIEEATFTADGERATGAG